MRRSLWHHTLRESGLCIDRVRLLDWVCTRDWARILFFRFLRLRFSPAILENALSLAMAPDERGRLYSLGMSYINVGDTYKTTASDRTTLADAELERLAGEHESTVVLEVGVSDGISALGLLRKGRVFDKVVLTDRFPRFYEKSISLGRVFLTADGALLGIKFMCFYLCLGGCRRRNREGYTPIETVNPVLRQEFGISAIQGFNVFCDRLDGPVELIKCSNILNIEYFGEWNIRRAVANLGRSLIDGGHMVISQNNPKYMDGESFFVLRRDGERLVLVRERNCHDVVYLFAQGIGLNGGESKEALRITLMAPSLEAGGAERQLVVLANGLADRGHRVVVALFRVKGPLLGNLSRQVVVHDLRKGGRADVVGLLLRLRCLLRSEAPDVLYTFLGVPNLAGVAMKLLVPGIRCLASVRASNMDMTRYGLLARLCCSAEAKLVRFADRIVANSYAGAECAVTRGMPGRKITVVPNGIDVETFRPARPAGESLRREWGVGSGDVLVGMPARLDPMKDHETFVRAAAIAAGRDHRMRFVCVGEERSPLGSSLRELGRSLGLGDRLIWAGRRDDMVSVYNSLDVCCLSSAYGEGFSNVLGEAMACGVPCVATDVGDAARIVGTAGAIVPPGDPEALAGALIAMAARGERAPVLALRESVVERFSIPAMLDRTEAVIRELAEA